MMDHMLSSIIFLPMAGAAAIMLFPSARAARWIALLTTVATFVLSLPLFFLFDKQMAQLQFTEQALWIPSWNIAYSVGVDGISLPFIFLAALLSILCVAVSWRAVETRTRAFYGALLVSETAMIGLFAAANLLLFYVFWELILVPIFLLIGVWGSTERVYAAVKFLLFTLAGSVLMLLGMIALYNLGGGTLEFDALSRTMIEPTLQYWLFGAFTAAFAVKVPMFPLHTWLPDAHTEAPTAGSVILAGILLKMGAYGFLRVCLPVLPGASLYFLKPMLALSVAAIIWGACVTLTQTDVKRLIAYSSVSHMGFVTLGIFSFTASGLEGAILQMINHGIITGALFLCVGMLYERTHTRDIARYGGLFKALPVYTVFLALFSLAATGFPGLNSFVGEFLILNGAFTMRTWLGLSGVLGVALGTMYMVWLFYRLALGDNRHPNLKDLDWREMATLAPLAALALVIGLYPDSVLGFLRVSVEHLLMQLNGAGLRAGL
ncbi:MAG: NADH-quinone oxidoreductase subunit M [Elusimicrobia bacterium]|nr:NADH-quinone oxidoreductase subunit M [Elusimicrobiota bacterium]